MHKTAWSGWPAALAGGIAFFAASLACGWGGAAQAQSFFATLVVDPVVGADRGSASRIQALDEPTAFLTFSNTGSDEAGRAIAGLGYGHPDLLLAGDQLDLALVVGGPSEDGKRELLAGGIGYRIALGDARTTGFVTVDYGDVILGSAATLPFDIRGDRLQVAAGVSHERDLGDTAELKLGAEILARRVGSEVLGATTIDEALRMLRVSALYSRGIPLLAQQRLAVSATKGIDGAGASASGNLLGSVPGADTDFLRVSFAAEASVPLSRDWVINAGVIGQWTEDSLPASQRCGFETNSYARAFDFAVVSGDRCLGSRVEAAYNIELPVEGAARMLFTQAFAGIDGGRIDNVANAVSPGGVDGWASLSAGIRTLRGDFLGEVAVTRILDRPGVAAGQDRDRIWFRAAYRF